MGYRGRQNGKVGMLRPTDKLMDHWDQFVDWLPSCSLNPFSCLVCFISFKIFKGSPGCVLKVAALKRRWVTFTMRPVFHADSPVPMLCRGIDPSSPEQMWMVTALWSQLRCRHSKWALQILRHPKLDISWPKSTTKYYTKYRMGLILMLLQLWNFPPPRSWKCFQARAVLVKSNLPQEQQTNHIQLCLSNLVMQNVIWSFTAVETRVSETGWAGADLYPGRCGQGALSLAGFLGLLLAWQHSFWSKP